jgi:hypothetical protein
MTELIARLDHWSDRLSPIVVKEIRQMVRGREFNYSFGISLLAGFLVAFFGLGFGLTSVGEAGAWVFSALMVCLGLLGLVVVPLGAYSALRNERVDQTFDLITQTTLSPRRIVIGKLMTQWIKLITLFAGLAPFIAMSFLLGGIDLLTILISLGVLFMWSMWVCALCLFLSAASQARAMSALLFIVMLIAFISIVVGFAPLLLSIIGIGGFGATPGPEVKWILLGSTAVCFTSMTNLVLLAENRLALAIEDRSTALRIGFFVQFLLALTCIVGPLVGGAPGFTPPDVILGIGIIGGIHLAVTAAFAVTEDMILSRRVFKRVRKSLGRPWFAIFRPGGGRGALWIVTQMIILLVAGWTVGTETDFHWLLAICGYIFFFSGVPTVLIRRIFTERVRTNYLRAGILLFFPLIALSADLFQYFVAPTRAFDSFSVYHILNPFRALGNWTEVENQGWYWGPMIMGIAGLIAYVELYRMGRREDSHAANSS